MQQLDSTQFLPSWLQLLLTEKFFNACIIHEEAKKNEKNAYCLDCCDSLCIHCLSSHYSHRVLQIRRYVYHDVVRLEDVQNLFDCSYIQFYTTNSAKVIFLNPRPHNGQYKLSSNICNSCSRSLQEQYLFCSISCKLDHIVKMDGPTSLSSFLFDCKFMPLPEPCSDGGLVTPDSVSTMTSSGSSGGGGVGCRTIASTATTEIVRKKRSSLTTCRPLFPRVSATFMNRRKNTTPNRAPLY